MNARLAAILLVLLAALGGGALLVRQQAGSQKPAEAASLGQPLLKDLQAADVAAIAIRQPKGAVITLQRKDDRWTIAERGGFPADFDKVRGFVLLALSLKIGQLEPIGEKDRARLNLDESGTSIEFLAADGKPLARFTAGRKYFKAEPENPARAIGDGRYVALPGDEKRVYVVSDPLTQASTKSADWINRTGIAVEKVKTVDVHHGEGPAGADWKVERSGDNADWKLAGIRAGEKLETTKANAAAYTLSQIDLADVAPQDLKPEDAGLATKPSVVTATTLDGLTYVLKVGKPEGDNYYASVAVSGERQVREKALAGYVVLIPKSKLDEILVKRSDLLAKKEEKKK